MNPSLHPAGLLTAASRPGLGRDPDHRRHLFLVPDRLCRLPARPTASLHPQSARLSHGPRFADVLPRAPCQVSLLTAAGMHNAAMQCCCRGTDHDGDVEDNIPSKF